MDFPIFNGSWRGLSVRASYEPEKMDVLVTVTGAGVALFSFRLTASEMEDAGTELANLLAPLARALGDEFASWWKSVAAHIRPVQDAPVTIGALRIPARLLAGFEMRQLARTKARPLPPPSEPVNVPAPAPKSAPVGLVAPDATAFAAKNTPGLDEGSGAVALITPPPAVITSGALSSGRADEIAAEQAKYDALQAEGKAAASTAAAERG